MRQQQPPENLSMMEKLNRWEWLIWLPALSIACLSRKDIGFRLLHRGYISGVTAIMFILAMFAPTKQDAVALMFWATLVFIMGFWNLFKRWREFNRGVKQHSYFLGNSNWNKPWMPAFIRRNRKIERFGEPCLFFLAAATLLLPFSAPLGLWVMFSTICLMSIEAKTWTNWRRAQMDMVDGLVHSEFQGETVEKFEQAPAKKQQSSSAIATGLDDDIARKIQQKKQNQSRQ